MTGKEYSDAYKRNLKELRKLLYNSRTGDSVTGWHRHSKKLSGSELAAGWVQDTAYVSDDCVVSEFSIVCDDATVAGGCTITNSVVGGNSSIRDGALMKDSEVWSSSVSKVQTIYDCHIYDSWIRLDRSGRLCRLSVERSTLSGKIDIDSISIGGKVFKSYIEGGYIHAEMGGDVQLDGVRMTGGEVSANGGEVWTGVAPASSYLKVVHGDVVTEQNFQQYLEKMNLLRN